MALRELRVCGYRSIRDVRLQLRPVNVVVGPNGCGKSNLYRAVYLLAQSVQGRLSSTLALEGGLPSALWAGPRQRGPVQIRLEIHDDDFAYGLTCGLPVQDPHSRSYFKLDPEVKEESLEVGGIEMLHRKARIVKVRDESGQKVLYPLSLADHESALSQIRDPQRYPELSVVRERLERWRFYHHFRTDFESPLRQPQVGVRTPVLSHDGHDLAAALQTIIEFGDDRSLFTTFKDAFPHAHLQLTRDSSGRFTLQVQTQGVQRWLDAREVSDGTLRFLCLVAALLTPQPPALLALNEPETSLHPDLIAPLARLIVASSRRSQLWVTTHSRALAEAVVSSSGERPIELNLHEGETIAVNATRLGAATD